VKFVKNTIHKIEKLIIINKTQNISVIYLNKLIKKTPYSKNMNKNLLKKIKLLKTNKNKL
jgi:hypothetical protein